MNPLRQLQDHGQSIWLDFIRRDLLTEGGLRRLIESDALTGVTSNPSIFEKAIAASKDYRGDLEAMRRERLSPLEIYERLAVGDVRAAADVLRPVYENTERRDGYVSLEVSPHLARDTARTIEEATRLWHTLARPNVMIKVPGTAEGIPAVRALIAEGINVNVTLLFSRLAYRAAAAAHLEGIEARHAQGRDVSGVASVASFFVSRIDTLIDAELDRLMAQSRDRQALEVLQGRAAIANAKLAYRDFIELISSDRWRRTAHAGAMPQRLLWASTSTKNPRYRDVIYVEELIGPRTVNTMPPATLEAFRDHGRVRASLEEDHAGAVAVMQALAAAGIDFDRATDTLLDEGVRLFAQAFDALLTAVERTQSSA
ncbi:MAG: transaldolase [Burkholderiales bacterium]|nr:transaldolase [Burkholderiales bacterium]